MLIGIVLRGSAFTFRSHYGHGGEHDDGAGTSQRWGRVFAIASVVTPVMLGLCVGAVASGAPAGRRAAAGFYDGFVAPWLAPFAWAWASSRWRSSRSWPRCTSRSKRASPRCARTSAAARWAPRPRCSWPRSARWGSPCSARR